MPAPRTAGGGRPWLLRAERAGKSYGETRALVDADLAILPGEAVAIMGPSGSGKSTLLHVLAGIIRADTGTVVLRRPGGDPGGAEPEHAGSDDGGLDDGGLDDIAALSDDARSALRLRRFGFVFQQGLLLPELTAAENVALPLLLAGRARAEAQRVAEAGLERLGLGGLGARRIGQLSGGQAQRVAIARALGAGPSIVFADEPTGALDSQTADEVLDALLATGRGPDRALILVTHDARVAERCDRIVRLRDGRIMADERSDGPGNVRSDAQDARPFAGRTEASR